MPWFELYAQLLTILSINPMHGMFVKITCMYAPCMVMLYYISGSIAHTHTHTYTPLYIDSRLSGYTSNIRKLDGVFYFNPGDRSSSLCIAHRVDSIACEPDIVGSVQLFNSTVVKVIEPSTATVTIRDDNSKLYIKMCTINEYPVISYAMKGLLNNFYRKTALSLISCLRIIKLWCLTIIIYVHVYCVLEELECPKSLESCKVSDSNELVRKFSNFYACQPI